MVVGNGMIATALKAVDSQEVLFSASGLSNLKGADPEQRLRERNLIKATIAEHREKIFVYISSYSIDDQYPENNTPYLEHKLQMEQLIERNASRYLIVRTSNVVGRSRQPGNLMNFIFNHLKQGTPFDVWTRTSRNLIDVNDLAQMAGEAVRMSYLNQVLYLIHPSDIPIARIVGHFETLSGWKGNYQLVDKGSYYQADKQLAATLFSQLGLEADPDLYTRGLIQKYFSDKF